MHSAIKISGSALRSRIVFLDPATGYVIPKKNSCLKTRTFLLYFHILIPLSFLFHLPPNGPPSNTAVFSDIFISQCLLRVRLIHEAIIRQRYKNVKQALHIGYVDPRHVISRKISAHGIVMSCRLFYQDTTLELGGRYPAQCCVSQRI